MAKGSVLNASYNYSKSLSNSDQLGYYNREGKARTSYDQENSFGAYVIYELPVGKGQKWLNRGGVLNAILGGWKVDVSENILSGIPLSVGSSGSPNRYLTASPVNALVPVEQVKIDHWSMGNRFPTAAQNPYFDINAFAYPASYTVGSLGARVLQAPGIWWMQCFATKSWKVLDERLKLSLRLDGHNLPWKRPQPFRAEYHVQSEQRHLVGQIHRRTGRLFKLRHRTGQRSGLDPRGVLIGEENPQ